MSYVLCVHWLLPLGDPELAIGGCSSGGITVVTVAPAHGADNVVPNKEDSGGPPTITLGLSDVGIGKKKKKSTL